MSRRARATAWLVGLWAMATVVSMTACAAGDGGSSSTPDRVRAVVLPFISGAPFHIAAAEGLFEEQNLDVEFVKLTRNIEAIPALVRGEVDVGLGQLTVTILNAIARGARLRLVAGTAYLARDGCTYNAVVARRDLVDAGRLDDAAQLRGLRVELDILLPAAFRVDQLLRPAGLTLDDLDIVNLPMPANIDALINGSIDVTVATEPYLTRLTRSGNAVIWRRSEQIAPDHHISSVVYGPSLLDERPEVGERLMVALLQAMRQYTRGKTPRNLDILVEGTGLSRSVLDAMCWPSVRDDAEIAGGGLMEFQEWLISRELVERLVPEDELIDRRFVERANAVLRP